jgi:hypothetical protein
MHWPVRYRPLVWIALVLGSSVATVAIGWSAAHAQLDPNVCFAVADTDDVLVSVNKTTGIETTIGLTTDATDTAISIEAIALPPAGSVLYAAAADRLGTLDRATGAFTALPNSFGTGDGFDGPVTFDDVKGLTFEPATGILYGSHRRPQTDVLHLRDVLASHARCNLHLDSLGGAGYVCRQLLLATNFSSVTTTNMTEWRYWRLEDEKTT